MEEGAAKKHVHARNRHENKTKREMHTHSHALTRTHTHSHALAHTHTQTHTRTHARTQGRGCDSRSAEACKDGTNGVLACILMLLVDHDIHKVVVAEDLQKLCSCALRFCRAGGYSWGGDQVEAVCARAPACQRSDQRWWWWWW